MGTTADRRQRVEWLMHRIELAKKQDRILDKQKLLAVCALETYCSERTAAETLNMLIHAGKVKL